MGSSPARPLRVLFVNHVARCGGAEHSLLSLLRQLPACGVEPHVAVPEGPLAESVRAVGLPVYPLPAQRLRRTVNPFSLAAQLRWLAQARTRVHALCAATGADLVHANSLPTALALAVRGPQLPPLVWHCRDLRLSPVLLRWLVPRCTGIIAISSAVRSVLEGAAGPLAAERCAVIHNGITSADLPPAAGRAAVRAAEGLPEHAPLVISVGQFAAWKRFDLALQAARLLAPDFPDLRWLLVGDALFEEDRATARALRKAAPENVVFTGYRADVAGLVRAADVFAHAACEEALGRVLLEAMLLGTPCVAPAAGGIPEVVEHGVSGWLVQPGSADALAQGVATLLRAPDLRSALTAAARERVTQCFSAAATARDTVGFYHRLRERADHAPRL